MEFTKCSCTLKGKWAYDPARGCEYPICASTRCLGKRLFRLAHKVENLKSTNKTLIDLLQKLCGNFDLNRWGALNDLHKKIDDILYQQRLIKDAFEINSEEDKKILDEVLEEKALKYGKRTRNETENSQVLKRHKEKQPEFQPVVPLEQKKFPTFSTNSVNFNFIMPTPKSFNTGWGSFATFTN